MVNDRSWMMCAIAQRSFCIIWLEKTSTRSHRYSIYAICALKTNKGERERARARARPNTNRMPNDWNDWNDWTWAHQYFACSRSAATPPPPPFTCASQPFHNVNKYIRWLFDTTQFLCEPCAISCRRVACHWKPCESKTMSHSVVVVVGVGDLRQPKYKPNTRTHINLNKKIGMWL